VVKKARCTLQNKQLKIAFDKAQNSAAHERKFNPNQR
jgi:hypothetical protein